MTPNPRRRPRGAAPAAPTASLKDDRRRVAALIGGVIVLGIVLWALTYRAQEVPLAGIDAEDYAQIGRQIAQGQGFTTLFLPLNGLAWLLETGRSVIPPWPNISRFPLPPLFMAGVFKVVGPSDLAASSFSLFGYLLGIPFAVLLGRQLGGVTLAALAGFLYAVHPDALQLSISALTEPLSASLLLAAAWLVLRRDARSHALAGAVFGIAYWNRTTLLLLALPALIVVWRRAAAPARSAALFCGLAAAFAAPWMAFMWGMTGDPLFNLQNATVIPFGTEGGPTDFPWYTFAYAPSVALGPLLAKWAGQVATVWELWPDSLGPVYLLALAVVGWAVCPPAAHALRWLALAWLVLQVVVYSFAGNITRFYTIFLPFVELFACLGVIWIAGKTVGARWGGALGGALILLVALPSIGAVTGLRPFEGSPSRSDALSAIVDVSLDAGPAIAAATRPTDLVLSNVPWSVAWRAQRPAAPLPADPSGLEEFERRTGLRVAALYLTPQVYIVGMPASWREWTLLRDRLEPPPGFRVERRLLHGGVLYLRNPSGEG
ncbi:MAG: glycosyltransferase family 39 protein [Chloroflexota bacterium]|nr:glycosyltransferase family 39 protein [Dehalococcoidia bacterium]MDW8254621.1 glycosyltransferase family 39 protein [Chloroflexota bacterium]